MPGMLHRRYRDMSPVVVPQDQLQSDNVLEDVACMLGCTRSSLHGADVKLFRAPAQPAGTTGHLTPGAHSMHVAAVQLQLYLIALFQLEAASRWEAAFAAEALFALVGKSGYRSAYTYRLTERAPQWWPRRRAWWWGG